MPAVAIPLPMRSHPIEPARPSFDFVHEPKTTVSAHAGTRDCEGCDQGGGRKRAPVLGAGGVRPERGSQRRRRPRRARSLRARAGRAGRRASLNRAHFDRAHRVGHDRTYWPGFQIISARIATAAAPAPQERASVTRVAETCAELVARLGRLRPRAARQADASRRSRRPPFAPAALARRRGARSRRRSRSSRTRGAGDGRARARARTSSTAPATIGTTAQRASPRKSATSLGRPARRGEQPSSSGRAPCRRGTGTPP